MASGSVVFSPSLYAAVGAVGQMRMSKSSRAAVISSRTRALTCGQSFRFLKVLEDSAPRKRTSPKKTSSRDIGFVSVSADLLSLLIVGVVVAGREGVGPHEDAPLHLVAEGALKETNIHGMLGAQADGPLLYYRLFRF